MKNNNKELKRDKIKYPVFKDNRLITYSDDTSFNIEAILNSIKKKNLKLKRRLNSKLKKYVLIIYSFEGGLIGETSYFVSFINDEIIFKNQFDIILILYQRAYFVFNKHGKIIKRNTVNCQ